MGQPVSHAGYRHHRVRQRGKRNLPGLSGPVLRSHWGVDDPAHASGSDEQIDAAFLSAYRTLRARIEAFLALPLDTLQHDKAALKAAMDQIATLTA
ncbi:hypothetical protein [Paludibacterium denitrificans]|uniref:hypothetical protein n=1 Tax=Paludibacterium denitrificans TaxID=2675226 RepID=UPI0035E45942